MITYELAKKLKEAGFPQKNQIVNNETQEIIGQIEVYYPTLSELIEACGRELVSLRQVPTIEPKGNEPNEMYFFREDGTKSPYLKDNRWYWEAVYFSDGNAEHPKLNGVEGDTPKEAVAKLWLQLNKKK